MLNQKLWCIIEPLIISFIEKESLDYIIEGVFITPANAKELIDKYPSKIKACWVGYPSSSVNKKFKDIRDPNKNDQWNWLKNCEDDFVVNIIKYGIEYSNQLLLECSKYNIPFVDSSIDFDKSVDKVIKKLNL